MKKFEIDPEIPSIIGGMFHQDTLYIYPDIADAILADLEVSSQHELQLLVTFCNELLTGGYTADERFDLWLKAGIEDGEFMFDDESLIAVLEFMRTNYSAELKRRFG